MFSSSSFIIFFLYAIGKFCGGVLSSVVFTEMIQEFVFLTLVRLQQD